ncbi:MAG: hypothetical protein M5R36_28715 [Deltaproteobacteria bacterium]|nr:hypothetical protein [Deltaproteobacteria bacterium]
MAWRRTCSAMSTECDASVDRLVRACLGAKDRRAYCRDLGDRSSSTHFGYQECVPYEKDRPLKKACALGFRVIDRFCKDEAAP